MLFHVGPQIGYPIRSMVTFCIVFLHCVSWNDVSNYFPQKMYNYIGCICLTFLRYVFSNVSSNRDACAASTSPTQGLTPAPWLARLGQSSRASPATMTRCATMWPAHMGQGLAWGSQDSMLVRWVALGPAGRGVQSTGGLWGTTGTLGWASTSTSLGMSWPTSTSSLSRRSEAPTPSSLRQERVSGLKNMVCLGKEEWTEGADIVYNEWFQVPVIFFHS